MRLLLANLNGKQRVGTSVELIEVCSGRIKQIFRYYHKNFWYKSLLHMNVDFRIVADIIDAFSDRVKSNNNEEKAIASRMLSLMNTPNSVRVLPTQMNLSEKQSEKGFWMLWSYVPGKCSRVSSTYRIRPANHRIRLYQLSQTKSYYAERVDEDGKYVFDGYKHPDSFHPFT